MRELMRSRGRNYAGSPGCFLKDSSSSLTTATETKADSLSVLLARARGIPCTFEDPANPKDKGLPVRPSKRRETFVVERSGVKQRV